MLDAEPSRLKRPRASGNGTPQGRGKRTPGAEGELVLVSRESAATARPNSRSPLAVPGVPSRRTLPLPGSAGALAAAVVLGLGLEVFGAEIAGLRPPLPAVAATGPGRRRAGLFGPPDLGDAEVLPEAPGRYPRPTFITPTKAVPAGWRVVLIDYPDGGREAVCYWQAYREADDAPKRRGRYPWEPPHEPTDAEKAKTLQRNGQRAKSKVRRVVRQRGLRMMVTFTWPNPGQWDREEAMATVAYLLEKHGSLIHQGGGYVVVAELHPDGHGWHVHVFTQVVWYRKTALQEMRILWTGLLLRRGWTLPGGTTWVRTHAKRWKSARRAGDYAGKYAAKALGDAGRGAGARRYTISLGSALVRTKDAQTYTRWGEVLKHGGEGVLVAWWRSWDEGEDPGGWPVAWVAWEPSGDSLRDVRSHAA